MRKRLPRKVNSMGVAAPSEMTSWAGDISGTDIFTDLKAFLWVIRTCVRKLAQGSDRVKIGVSPRSR